MEQGWHGVMFSAAATSGAAKKEPTQQERAANATAERIM